MNSLQKTFLWFDIGYTLLYLKREELFINLMKERESTFTYDTVREAFHLTDKLFMREYRGVLGKDKDTYMPWYFGNLFHSLGIRIDLCSFYNTWKENISGPLYAWHLCPGAMDTLKYLKNNGFRLGIISNWDKSARPLLKRLHILDFFEVVVISSEVGYEKPSKKIFTIALNKADVSPEESLYIGDNYYDDALGSAAVGMDAVIINRFGKKGIEEIPEIPVIENLNKLQTYFL